jgi:hypothetical protein
MNTSNTSAWILLAALSAALLAPESASLAQDDVEWVTTSRGRYEIAIGAHSWPGLADLDSVRNGQFDEVGFNISLAAHWPVKRFTDSELLAGVDLGLFANESNIRFTSDSLIARNGYLAPSLKWMFGSKHRYSLDARGGEPTRSRGAMMSLKVHFVDFGTVRDDDFLPPTLGQDAGRLTGPIYMYQVGYRWR